jgi:SAM-dependent methyltransferase
MSSLPIKDKVRIRSLYDASSVIYRELYGDEQRYKYSSISNKYLPSQYESILDAGCGISLFAENISEKVYYVGIDISLKSLSLGKALHSRENTDYIYGDIDSPPFRAKSFDKVYSFTQIHHEQDHLNTLDILKNLAQTYLVVSYLKKVFEEPPDVPLTTLEIVDGGVDWIGIYSAEAD